jgi:predicted phage terminase large subunit-like protein
MTEPFRPQAGPQEQFLKSSADIVIYGGAAGGGKTIGILMEAARHLHRPGFKAVLFRRTYPEIRNPGGLWDSAGMIFPLIGGEAKDGQNAFVWPNGSRVQFSHMQHEGDKYAWQGSALPFIGFDELTHFTRSVFFYMLSRNRLPGPLGMRPYVRATCNPDANSWVAQFLSWWLDEKTGLARPERSGVVRWFIRDDDKLLWSDSPEKFGDKADEAKSVTFIPAKVTDNRILLKNDPDYLRNLKSLSLVERSQLLDGNWKIRPVAGMFFKREWFEVVDAAPAMAGEPDVRYWDRAATPEGPGARDPDWTVGLCCRYVKGIFYILDVARMRERPNKVKSAMRNCATQDGPECVVVAEEDPGQAGKSEVEELSTLFPDRVFHTRRVTTKKALRARIASAQAEQGNIKLVRGRWNEDFLDELENFADWDQVDEKPDTMPHDDQVDSLSGAVNYFAEQAINSPSVRY